MHITYAKSLYSKSHTALAGLEFGQFLRQQ